MALNNLLWIGFILVDLSLAVVLYRFFGKYGLYTIIVVSIVTSNIQVLKTVELFSLVATLGNVLYGSVFFATDILSEVYGKKSARRGVWLGVCPSNRWVTGNKRGKLRLRERNDTVLSGI